jgi:sarcosine oxidase subunit beta
MMMKEFSRETGWNPILYLGGYLWLIFDEKILRAYEDANRRLWSKYGVPVDILYGDEVKTKYPYLNVDGLVAGVLGRQDGKIHHDYVTFGYYYAFKKLGGEVIDYTPVEHIVVKNEHVVGVETPTNYIEADNVIIAAGAWSRELFKQLDIDLPLEPSRKELCVLEPTKFFIKPLIIDTRPTSRGLYICQTPRGEIMGSVDYPKVLGKYEFNNTIKYLSTFAKQAINLIPKLKYLSFLRIWSGDYNVSPDHSHILGRDKDWPEGLYTATGYSGHGFMLAPYTGLLMAEYIVDGILSKDMEPFLPKRFKENRLINETMVIG